MPIRYDVNSIGEIKKTDQGYLNIPIVIGKADCVLSYRRNDGSVIKEFRSRKEVMKSTSYETAKAAHITEGHVTNLNSDNTHIHAVGHIRDDIHEDGNLLAATALITRADIIEKIENKELHDISPGYIVDIDGTPGEYNGERYDQSQINIRYNHFALLPKGSGRQGKEVGLRLDSDDGIEIDGKYGENKMKVKIRIDGKDYEIEVSNETEAQLLNDMNQRLDEKEKKCDELNGEIKVLKKNLDSEKERADKAESLDNVNSIVEQRLDAIDKIKKLNPEIKKEEINNLKKKSVKELRLDALHLAGFDKNDYKDKSDDYIEGSFKALSFSEESGSKEIKAIGGIIPKASIKIVRQDEEDDDWTKAEKEMNEIYENAWRKEVK
jgi:hypothetical protein